MIGTEPSFLTSKSLVKSFVSHSHSSLAGNMLVWAFAFNVAVPVFADGTVLIDLPAMRSYAPSPAALPAGPSVAQLHAAFPDRSLQRMEPEAFQAFVQAHAGQGRFLSGVELAAALDRQAAPAPSAQISSGFQPPRAARTSPANRTGCDSLPSLPRSRCLDSLARRRGARTYAIAGRDESKLRASGYVHG